MLQSQLQTIVPLAALASEKTIHASDLPTIAAIQRKSTAVGASKPLQTREVDLMEYVDHSVDTVNTPSQGLAKRQRHTIDISTPDSPMSLKPINDVRQVEISDSCRSACAHCGDVDATWLFWICRHLCESCRVLKEYRTICRSQACKQYHLTLPQVIAGQDDGSLQVFYVPNPHNTGRNAGRDKKSTWMKLYFVNEIEEYAAYWKSKR